MLYIINVFCEQKGIMSKKEQKDIKLQINIEIKNGSVEIDDPKNIVKTSESKQPKKKFKLND